MEDLYSTYGCTEEVSQNRTDVSKQGYSQVLKERHEIIWLLWAGYTGVKIPNEDPCLSLSIKEYLTFQLISLEIRVHLNEMSPGAASPHPGPPCCAPLRTAHITRNARQLVFIN